MGHRTLLTKRVDFAASHRYWNANWSEAKNLAVFGKCTSKYGHGHNYILEVTIEGDVDPETGMIINLYDLKPMINDVLKDFDHKYLNEDNAYFQGRVPTTENIARAFWELIEKQLGEGANRRLYRIRLYERPDLFVDYRKV